MGGPATDGPFQTRADAEAFLRANYPGLSLSHIVGSADALSSPSTFGPDNTAAERAAEPAAPQEADRKAREEADRLAREAEDRRKLQEFEAAKRAAIGSLKGVFSADSELKPAGGVYANGPGGLGLKGVPETGIKTVPQVSAANDLGGRESAWKQLHATAFLIGLSASSTNPSDAVYFAEQAYQAANGGRPGVVVPTAGAMPRWAPDMHATPEYRAVRKIINDQLIQGAKVLVDQQKQLGELTASKAKAEAELKAAEVKVAQLSIAPPVATPGLTNAPPLTTVTPVTPVIPPEPKSPALAAALAALASAQQANTDASRVHRIIDAEVKSTESKMNAYIGEAKKLEQMPDSAADMFAKLQSASAQPSSSQ